MRGIKASYLLTNKEILFLIECSYGIIPSPAAAYLKKEYMSGDEESGDVVEGLIYKKLAHKDSKKLIIEPVIDLIIKFILSSKKLWILKCKDIDKYIFVISSYCSVLLMEEYFLTTDTWKITPYPDMEELKKDRFDDLVPEHIAVINENGEKCDIDIDDNFKWLEG